MKKIFLVIVLVASAVLAHGQKFGGLLDKAKKKVEDKMDKKVDDTVDGKQAEESKPENNSGGSSSGKGESSSTKVYSKFDFVPGEKVVVMEDFMQDAVGDFPDKWNTNASGEVVTFEGKPEHWLKLTQHGVFMPEFIDSLPLNFTFEFDLTCDNLVGSWGLQTSFAELADRKRPEDWRNANNRFTFEILPGGEGNGSCSYERRKEGVGEGAISATMNQFANKKSIHVAVWRQKERVRIYLDETKVWDVPKAILLEAKLNALTFNVQLIDGQNHFILSNLRLAVGAPDTRNKLLTEGKWVTHGILFDVNSANIKPESYGTMKEIAGVLKDNADVKVKIIGHTDSDGDDKSNMELSKRRAAAVKDFLAKEFSIDATRMETDGMGESKPVDKNTTPEGKANNRRVEFVKI